MAALADRDRVHNGAMTTNLGPAHHDVGAERTAHRLAAMLIGMGILHFAVPRPFDALIPAELPGKPRFYTRWSGVAELLIGALLLPRSTRRRASEAAVALFVAVYPANVNMVRLWWNKPWPARIGAIARLPLQVPMITTALRVRRAS